MWMLQRRFRPLERLIERIEQVDPAAPDGARAHRSRPAGRGDRPAGRVLPAPARARGAGAPPLGPARDARAGGGAPPPGARPPRRGEPGPHRDPAAAGGARPGSPPEHAQEVAELKRLVNQAMDELLNLARQLRPSALDDHGLVPAIDAQLKRFAARTGVEVRMQRRGRRRDARGGRADGGLPGRAGGADQRRAPRRAPPCVEVDLEVADDRTELRVRDDGGGFDPGRAARRTRGPGAPASGCAGWPSAPGWWAASSTCARPPAAAPRSP